MENKPFYTPQEIADDVGVNVITIRRYIAAKKLKASRIGKRLFRISREDYAEFLKSE